MSEISLKLPVRYDHSSSLLIEADGGPIADCLTNHEVGEQIAAALNAYRSDCPRCRYRYVEPTAVDTEIVLSGVRSHVITVHQSHLTPTELARMAIEQGIITPAVEPPMLVEEMPNGTSNAIRPHEQIKVRHHMKLTFVRAAGPKEMEYAIQV